MVVKAHDVDCCGHLEYRRNTSCKEVENPEQSCKVWSRNVVKRRKYSPRKLSDFVHFCITAGKTSRGRSCYLWGKSGYFIW